MLRVSKKGFLASAAFSLFTFSLLCVGATPAKAQPDDSVVTTEATSKTLMSAQQASGTTQSVYAVFDRLAFLAANPANAGSGFSSGEAGHGVNLWANPYYTHAHDTNLSTGYDSDTVGAFVGGDYKFTDRLTSGVMLGIDGTNINSKVNGGGSDSTGVTFAPYMRFSFNNTYSTDLTVGYTNSKSDNDRLATGTRVTGSSDTDRVFGALGANASFWQERWNFLARVGTVLSRDYRDSFTESNGTYVGRAETSFGQAQIGGTVGYYFASLRPWLSATYAYDYTRKLPDVAVGQVKPSDDRDQIVLGLGATVFNLGPLMGDLSVKQTVFKENYDNTQVGLTLSASF